MKYLGTQTVNFLTRFTNNPLCNTSVYLAPSLQLIHYFALFLLNCQCLCKQLKSNFNSDPDIILEIVFTHQLCLLDDSKLQTCIMYLFHSQTRDTYPAHAHKIIDQIQYNRNTTRRCRTKKCIARSWSNLVNEPEGWVHQVWPCWVQYTSLFCTWVLYSFYYMPFCDITHLKVVFEPPSRLPPFQNWRQLCST